MCSRLEIARDAIEDGRFEEVVALLHGPLYGSHAAAAATHAPTGAGLHASAHDGATHAPTGAWPTLSNSAAEGDGWMMLGMALLNLGRWHEAHAAWHTGALLAPSHALLAKQARKDAAYAVAAEAGDGAHVPLAVDDEAPSPESPTERRNVPSASNTCTRLFPKSATTTSPEGVGNTDWGWLSCPAPVPCVPHLRRKRPSKSST